MCNRIARSQVPFINSPPIRTRNVLQGLLWNQVSWNTIKCKEIQEGGKVAFKRVNSKSRRCICQSCFQQRVLVYPPEKIFFYTLALLYLQPRVSARGYQTLFIYCTPIQTGSFFFLRFSRNLTDDDGAFSRTSHTHHLLSILLRILFNNNFFSFIPDQRVWFKTTISCKFCDSVCLI